MNILDMLRLYLKHQEEVVTRRTKYELNKAEERAHILKGLLYRADHIDEVIKIRRVQERPDWERRINRKIWLNRCAGNRLLWIKPRALTGLEREKLEWIRRADEENRRIKRQFWLIGSCFGDPGRDSAYFWKVHGDERRTSIGFGISILSMEDLIPRENIVITMTRLGYIKRMTMDTSQEPEQGRQGD